MSISSLIFIFAFLPVCLVGYYILPGFLKNLFLLLASLVFYAWGEPAYLIVLIISVLFNYLTGLQISVQMDEENEGGARLALITGVIFNVAVLGFFKYYGFVLTNINGLFHTNIPIQSLSWPIGISFFTFSVLSYLFDVYRGESYAQTNIIDFGLFVAFFAKISSGPIVRYADMERQFGPHRLDRGEIGAGAAQFIRGLGKKVLIADNFGTLHSTLTALPSGQVTLATAWLTVIAYTLQIYFDFGGYSDMAIGLGRMFGFKITQNFDYPYISKTITEFWRRWHMTLGTWFREYIYIPLGGNREGVIKHLRNIMIVWLLTGIWHGAAWNFILWGVYYGILQLIEKYFLKDILDRLPDFVSHIYTMLFVMIGWAIFSASSLGEAGMYVGRLVGIGCHGLVNSAFFYYVTTNLPQLIFGIVCSTPLVYKLYRRIVFKRDGLRTYVSCGIYIVVLLCCFAYLINATYQSFLYVQF